MLMVLTSSPVATIAAPHWWGTLANWGNIGSFLGGASGLLLAAAAIIGGSAGLGDWRAKQREQKDLAREQAERLRLERQRILNGWNPGVVAVYGVELVTERAEIAKAQDELAAGGPSDYVLLRVNERPRDNVNRAHSLRELIRSEGYIARPPTPGEYEALEAGRKLITDSTLGSKTDRA